MKKALVLIALAASAVVATAQGWRNDHVDGRWQARPHVDDVVYRSIERDNRGNRVIVTTTYTCEQAGWQRDRRTGRRTVVCYEWDKNETREYVRRHRSNSYDLNGDGRTDGWERLLYQGFRDVLEDDNN